MINQILLVFVGIFAIIGLITFLYGIVEGLSHEKKTHSKEMKKQVLKSC